MSSHDNIRKLAMAELKELTDSGEPFTSRTIAKRLITDHAEEVSRFVEEQLETVMTQEVRYVVTEYRNRQRSSLNYFGEISQILPSESSGRLLYAVDHTGFRKEVAKMTRADALYVIGLMHSRASDQLAIATWLEHLSKDLQPDQVVSDLYQDQEIDRAYKRLVQKER